MLRSYTGQLLPLMTVALFVGDPKDNDGQPIRVLMTPKEDACVGIFEMIAEFEKE